MTRLTTVILLLFLTTACDPQAFRDQLPWEIFTMVSTSMEPTIARGSSVISFSVVSSDLARSDLVVVNRPSGRHIYRLVGMPGDRVALIDGEITLNGTLSSYKNAGTLEVDDGFQTERFKVLLERFPDEAQPHRILDKGPDPNESMAEIIIPAGQYFLLSDNRESAADSRIMRTDTGRQIGIGLVKARQIKRRVSLD